MSRTKRFLADISVLLGELGAVDESGGLYTGQIDGTVCKIADKMEEAFQKVIIMSHLTEMDRIERTSQQLDKLLGTEDTLLHQVFLKYQALEAEREAKLDAE